MVKIPSAKADRVETEYATVGMDGPLLSQSLPMPSLEHLTVLGWLARSYVEIENHAFAMTGKI